MTYINIYSSLELLHVEDVSFNFFFFNNEKKTQRKNNEKVLDEGVDFGMTFMTKYPA